jgi:eukaryotic-like serine/threonine-protein kinase
VIGSGGHGSVWSAYCRERKLHLAIKILHSDLVNQRIRERGPTIADRFLAEAKILQNLHHPGLCKIFDVIEDREQNTVAYTMELLHGSDLTVATGNLKLAELLNIFAKTADTLQYLHENNVIHRDVKPANIFINRPHTAEGDTRQIKLLDFGVAKELHKEAILTETATGIFVGSIQTMAPESIKRWGNSNDDGVLPQIDQWALAVSLYQCLSGKLPFAGGNVVDLILSLEQDEPTPLALRSHYQSLDVEEMLTGIVETGLQKDPKNRYADMNAFADALRSVTRTLGDGVGTVVTSTDFLESTMLSQRKRSAEALQGPAAISARSQSSIERLETPSNVRDDHLSKTALKPASNPAIRRSIGPSRASNTPTDETPTRPRSIVQLGVLEFYLWLMTILVLGFIVGFVVREL